MLVHRVDSAPHHRCAVTVAGHEMGRMTSMTVRRTIQKGSLWL